MRRHEVAVSLDKVCDVSAQGQARPEGRQSPRHPWPKILHAGLLGAAGQVPTLHRIEAECRSGVLATRIGPLSAADSGLALERQAAEPVFRLGGQIARPLKRNGVLRSAGARGRLVAGGAGEDIQSSHRLVAVVVLRAAFAVPRGSRFLRPGEGEVGPAGARLADLVTRLGRRFGDILVAAAVYLPRPFVQRVEQGGVDWVFTVKESQPDRLAAATRGPARPPDHRTFDPDQDRDLGPAAAVHWPVADRSGRVGKAGRTLRTRQVTGRREPAAKQRTRRDQASEPRTNAYASPVDLGTIPPQFSPALGRSRWRIDVEGFQTLPTDWHLTRPAVPQQRSQALVLLSMSRVRAYLPSRGVSHRQICSHWHGRARARSALRPSPAIWGSGSCG